MLLFGFLLDYFSSFLYPFWKLTSTLCFGLICWAALLGIRFFRSLDTYF